MRAHLIAALMSVGLGFVVRMEADNWSSWTVKREGIPYELKDPDRQRAFEQLSYCLMYGGTTVVVLSAFLDRKSIG